MEFPTTNFIANQSNPCRRNSWIWMVHCICDTCYLSWFLALIKFQWVWWDLKKIISINKPFIISPLINICNKVVAHDRYPERLKLSLINPFYKSGDKSSPTNYRIISLLPVFSKIFKKILYKRLFDHLNNNVILNEQQYGFRSKVSTENASYILLNEIQTALNNK